jgi:hypothetical protein
MWETVSSDWSVIGIGDFNGDGLDDILWRNVDGTISNWLATANGDFTINDANALHEVETSWNVPGVGDFNGDGQDDVLWRSDAGALSDWLSGAEGSFAVNDANALTTVSTNWQVVGVGDFNGDGRSDILWRNDAGQVSDWLGQANGGFVTNDQNAFTSAGLDWTVAGVGDFNGDGRGDVLWRNDQGQISNWLGQQNGGFVSNDQNAFSDAGTDWTVAGIADFNGDGGTTYCGVTPTAE